ncbi:MAG: acetate--CoA ligase family protein [Deltaproteobacteria bacterium]
MSDAVLLQNLKTLFNPKTVAVIGASEKPDKLGFHVMKSLTFGGFKGTIVPVNPSTKSVMNLPAFSSLGDFAGQIELAIVVLPARLVPGIFQECADKGVKGIVLISAGFREIDDSQGAVLQETLTEMANKAGIPVIGPNTFGMVNLRLDLNASFTPEFSGLAKGGIALVSQSGGISHLMGFTAMRLNAGISKIVGLGNRLNVDFSEMVPYLMTDPDTRVIALYLEGLDEPRRLMEALGKTRLVKPVVAYKTGSSRTGNQASLSHTGSLAGRQEIYEGALKQCGTLHVDSAERLLDAARALDLCPLPEGRRVAILSGQAGPAMAASDVCEREGMEIAVFHPETQRLINSLLPPLALRTNPVDMGPAWYNTSAIEGIIGAVMEDPGVDAILLLMMFASANREAVSGFSDLLLRWEQRKPVVACLVAPPGIWDREVARLEDGGALINVPAPERAAKTLALLWEYRKLKQRSVGVME